MKDYKSPFSHKVEYMDLPCAKCHQYKALAVDWYDTKQGTFIVKYNCTYCNHNGKRSSKVRLK